MKKVFYSAIFIFLTFFYLLTGVSAQSSDLDEQAPLRQDFAGQEHIRDFQSNVSINKDGTIDVSEVIKYDFASLDRHGIYRLIPYTKVDKQGKRVVLKFSNFKVTDENGKKYKFQKSTEDWNQQLKIGDPDKTITGVHTYWIRYKVAGALGYFNDHDELYWNATGNEWNVPIASASSNITFTFPHEDITSENTKRVCYTGAAGSSQVDCDSKTFTTTRSLFIGEGLTVVYGFPKNNVAVLLPEPYVPFFERWYGRIVLFGLILLATFWYIIYPIKIILKWLAQGRDPKAVMGETSAWYDPPKTRGGRPLTPAEVGALLDEKADNEDISAMIVDLARRGYFKIEERAKKDFYFIRKMGPKKDVLQPFENTLISGIFSTDEEVRIKDEKLYTTISSIKGSIYSTLVHEGFFLKSPESTRNFYIAMGIFGLTTLNLPVFISALLFGRHIPAKTQAGSDAAAVGRSLKNFLTSQEKQLEYQASKQLMFERLLPFAVAFGVEKIWADRFKDLNLKQPEWYSSYGGGHFSSTHFTSSLNSSFASVASASTPPSSSSSGFSGGSSGGGGGGGGGGSW